jgi:hypothetical protein
MAVYETAKAGGTEERSHDRRRRFWAVLIIGYSSFSRGRDLGRNKNRKRKRVLREWVFN